MTPLVLLPIAPPAALRGRSRFRGRRSGVVTLAQRPAGAVIFRFAGSDWLEAEVTTHELHRSITIHEDDRLDDLVLQLEPTLTPPRP